MQEMTGRGDACLQLNTLLPYLTLPLVLYKMGHVLNQT